MATTNTKTATSLAKHNYLRTLLAVALGSLAATLIITSVIVLWLGRTLTDTDTYVSKVAPLVKNRDIQEFTVDAVADGLLETRDAPVQDLANQLLGTTNVSGKAVEQLGAEVRPVVEDTIRSIVTSEGFATLWEETNRNLHSQLITQLNGEGSTVQLNFRPVITGVVDQLGSTNLAPVQDHLQIPEDVGMVTLEGEQIKTARDAYDNFKRSLVLIVLVAVATTAAAIAVSVHHLKTLRRVALTTGIFAGIMAILLGATSFVNPTGADAATQKMAIVVFNALTSDLRTIMAIIAVVCIVGALGSKLYAVMTSQKPVAK